MVAMAEVKAIMPQSHPGHGHGEGLRLGHREDLEEEVTP
jgi:hypothetical protein